MGVTFLRFPCCGSSGGGLHAGKNLGNGARSGDLFGIGGGLVVMWITWGEMILDPVFRAR